MKVLALYNLKGGVGKTASAVNLAYLAAVAGARTLIWDLDPQGAASYYFRIRPRVKGLKKMVAGRRSVDGALRGTDFPGLDLLPADFSARNLDLLLEAAGRPRKRLVRLVEPLASRYDRVYLDCPPGLSLLSESIFRVADALLVPTIPTTLSLRALAQLDRHLARKGPAGLLVWPFFSQVDRRKALHRETLAQRGGHPFPVLHATIPYSSQVERMGLVRSPVVEFSPRSAPARSYLALQEEIERRLAET